MSPGTGARQLQEELAALRARLLEMSAIAEDLVRNSIEALARRDQEKASAVILADEELDALELEVDETCINLLALQQPVARDLRLIIMTMRISNDLERIGDHAVNIAEAALRLHDAPAIASIRELDEMARVAREMVSDALDSFVRGDAASALDVWKRDDHVDALQDSLFRILLTHMMEDHRRIGRALTLILVSRNIERIADLATNIAEDVVYLVEGRTIKHRPVHALSNAKAAGDETPAT